MPTPIRLPTLHSVCLSPTNTSFSVPFRSDTSFLTCSPISEPEQNTHYTGGFPSSLPIYGKMSSISSQDFVMNWATPDVAISKQQQQHIQHVTTHAMPNDMECIKSPSAPYTPFNSLSYHQQQHRTPTIHTVPSQSQVTPTQRQPHLLQRTPLATDTLFDVDVDAFSLCSIFDLCAHQAQAQHQHQYHFVSPLIQPAPLTDSQLHLQMHLQQQQQHHQVFAAELPPTALPDAWVRYGEYGGTTKAYAGVETHVPAVEQGYLALPDAYPMYDPRFVSGCEDGSGETMFADAAEEEQGDVDAEGEDDLDGYVSSAGYPYPQRQQQGLVHQRGESPDIRGEPAATAAASEDGDGEEQDDAEGESEEDADDVRDLESVLTQPKRHAYSSSVMQQPNPASATGSQKYAGRSLRLTRYNPYPSSYSPSPPADTRMRHSNSRTSRSKCHTRRSKPHTRVPEQGGWMVPMPYLTKQSRGRRVPTMEDFEDGVVSVKAVPEKWKAWSAGSGRGGKGARSYMCDVEGCRKLFVRGEHMKRHVQSVHTDEKPHKCPHPRCAKDFSRQDNLRQHMRVHM